MSDVNIFLSGKLDIQKSIEQINKDIPRLEQQLKSLKLNVSIDNEMFKNITTQIKELNSRLNLNLGTGNMSDQLDKLTHSYKYLEDGSTKLNKVVTETTNKHGEQVKLVERLNQETQNLEKKELTITNNKKKGLELEEKISLFKKQQELSIQKIEGRYSGLYDTQAIKEYRDQLKQLDTTTPSVNNKMKDMALSLKQIEVNAQTSKRALDMSNKSAISLGNAFKTAFEKFSVWIGVTSIFFGSIRAIKSGVNEVIELNTAMTELNKVLEVSQTQLDVFTKKSFEMAQTLGRTGKDVLLATSEFTRAGYELQESGQLAEQALLLTNIADGLNDTAEAAGYLIAVLKGYRLAAEDTAHVVDVLNEVSNNYAVNTIKLAEGMQRTSGTISQTGTSMEELAGILTGGFEVLRNMEKVSSGLVLAPCISNNTVKIR